jgi:hypothetical protein
MRQAAAVVPVVIAVLYLVNLLAAVPALKAN